MIPMNTPPVEMKQEVPGYSAVVTSNTIVVITGTVIRKLVLNGLNGNAKLFHELHAAIRAEEPLVNIEDILQRQ